MSTTEYQPRPVRVSPLIKFGRWSFLTLGIFYGLYHNRRLTRKAEEIKAEETKRRVIRAAQLAEQKRLQNIADQKMFDEWSAKPAK